jgi:hypothetical protein
MADKPIKIYWHLNELANWREVFDKQWNLMIKSGLADAAADINLCANGRYWTFGQLGDEILKRPNVRFHHVHGNAALWEYPTLNKMKLDADSTDQDYAICYIHLKGLTRWGNENVRDWVDWLNWCTIERWQDNAKALESFDTSGPNWETEPWPHHSSNFWWANASYVRGLVKLRHPEQSIMTNSTQFAFHGHWRFDMEAWIGSGTPNAFEVARSFAKGGDHYDKPYPASLYRTDLTEPAT